jgi:hypothetical protein
MAGKRDKPEEIVLMTCRGSFIQSQLEPRIGLRHLARWVQCFSGVADRTFS